MEKEIELALERMRKQKEKVRQQNEKAKESYDRVSVVLPKGTKERILETGETINGYINRLVIEDMDRRKVGN